MAAPKSIYVCQECGHSEVRWLGKCPDCQQWNTFIEEIRLAERAVVAVVVTGGIKARILADISGEPESRSSTASVEFDRILGGGMVLGSVVLIGGEPGVGKSTLLLQVMDALARGGRKVLYASGEESALQLKLRSERLKIASDNLFILTETNLESVVAEIKRIKPAAVVIDSVQALFSSLSPSPPGTIVQIREVARQMIELAKSEGISTFLVGHVTKEGNLAGPKILEHMVDTVLYFEGETGSPYRIIRSMKNRFGSTNEVAIFQMSGVGLKEVTNPSLIFLGESEHPQPGTVVIPSLEGRRPILVEVQALISPSGYATGRRSVNGLDQNRVIMLLAVLEKRGGLVLGSSDVYVNAAGGLKVIEPAADLGILLAMASSHLNHPLGRKSVVLGEVSLTGELRAVAGTMTRLKEASKLGFERCLLPSASGQQIKGKRIGIDLVFASKVEEAVSFINS